MYVEVNLLNGTRNHFCFKITTIEILLLFPQQHFSVDRWAQLASFRRQTLASRMHTNAECVKF